MQTSAYEHINYTRLHTVDMQTLHSSAYKCCGAVLEGRSGQGKIEGKKWEGRTGVDGGG